ncbi:MAG: hypothetical protein ABI651_00955 [Verrucomicrobiota bacterium]
MALEQFRSFKIIKLVSAAACFAMLMRFLPSTCDGSEIAAGPLFQQFKLTLDPGDRTEGLGPLLSIEHRDTQVRATWPPFMAYRLDKGTDSVEFDFLYPVFTYDRFGSEYRIQLGQLFSFAGGQNQQENIQGRFTLFPVYFRQRSSDPALNYTAVLPFYGQIKNRLFRDEINFVMFPFYVQTRKRDVITDNYLFPLVHRRHGASLSGWQVWPLIGKEQKGVTTRTNSMDEVETIGGHKRFFVLWPLFFRNELATGTDNPQKIDVLLPFYALERSPHRDSSTYLWPLFTFTNDRERKYREMDLVGPLVVFAHGEGKTMNRVWPFFSSGHNQTLTSSFFLWPVYKFNGVNSFPLKRERRRILFFLYSDIKEKNLQTGATFHRTDFLPFFTSRRELNGNQRFQFLAPLEPFLPNNKSIERNYSPLWSLWRYEKNAKTMATSQSLFWNLYRRDTTPTTKKCSLLFGLFQYHSEPEGKRLRLFYIPIAKVKRIPAGKAGASMKSDYVPEYR